MKPEISVFGGGHRPENWMIQYESFGENDINWERIIVGPNPPNYILPDNFKFIQSNVKPVQSMEIAARLTKGDLIMQFSDDATWKTQHPLDKLYNAFQYPPDDFDNHKLMVSPRFCIDWGTHIEDCSRHPTLPCHHFFADNPESPILVVSGLCKREWHVALGGYDSQFIAGAYDKDFQLRFQEMGGRIILTEVFIAETTSLIRDSHVNGAPPLGYAHHDISELLEKLWKINRIGPTPDFHRSMPIIPFTDDRILEISQGPKGRWN